MANIEKISSVVQNEKIVEKINELADGVNSSLKEAPVLSVNGQTGEVQITRVENADNADTLGGKSSSEFATAEQGNKADTALQAGDVTKQTVGLENVANERQYSAENPPPYPVVSVAGKAGSVSLVKNDVGLNNVDNTSDLDKPVSTAQSVAIADAKKAGTDALDVANSKYEKPNDGIPKADLDVGVQASLSKADTALQNAPVTSVNGATGDVQIDVPTKLSELTNDKGFITATVNNLTNYYTKTLTYTKTEVDNLLSAIPKFGVSVVDSLPTTGISSTTVYLIPNTAPDDSNLYDEYIYVLGKWEKLGTAKIDLSNYVTVTQLNSTLASYATKTEVNAKYTKPSTGIPKSDLASAVQTSLNKADSALQSESDPTVPAWAKQPNKPSYTKSEVGLSNVANERQYSVNNPPPYPVVADGNYDLLGAGYLQQTYIGIGASNIGWWKIGQVPISSVSGTKSVSIQLLVNGTYADLGKQGSANSGILEWEIRVSSNAIQYQQISVLCGNLESSVYKEFCCNFDSSSNNAVLYVNLQANYRAYKITKLSEQIYGESATFFVFDFLSKYYGSSAPSGAIYATVRNNASNVNNPNLLINSNFAINQRGQSSYTGKSSTTVYTVDRWAISYSTLTFTPATRTLDVPVNGSFLYYIDNSDDILGKTVTISTKFNNVVYSGSATLANSYSQKTYIIDITMAVGKFQLIWDNIKQMLVLQFAFNNQTGSFVIDFVKLELGDTATEYIPPDPATELLKCRRYYGEYLVHFGCIWSGDANFGFGSFLFDTKMRTNPTMETYSPQSGNQKGPAGTVRQISTTNLTQTGDALAYGGQGFEVYTNEGFSGYMKYQAIVTADAEIY